MQRHAFLDARDERHAVVLLPPRELLGTARDERGDELVGQLGERGSDDRDVVLPVDDRERSQLRDESSPSIRAVYFSNSSVSVENWMIRSCPWNG